MGWRLAKSLQVLSEEVQQVAPGTTIWDIGNEEHQQEDSDHNPNSAGVVCAIDVLNDAGLDLDEFASRLVSVRHNALKYVIFDREIAGIHTDWSWRSYHGDNPHANHVHVSVGRGPDGYSTGPYDDTTPWGISTEERGVMFPKYGDEGQHVRYFQRRLQKLGYELPEYGPDGVYKREVQTAITEDRSKLGYRNPERQEITGWHAEELDDRLAKLRAREAVQEALAELKETIPSLPENVELLLKAKLVPGGDE